MSAYMIIRANVSDWQQFQQYTHVVPALVKQFGGEYMVMDSTPETLETVEQPFAGSVVVSKWPSKQAAHQFWQSAEYQQAIALRQGTGEFDVVLVDGLGV